MTLPSPPGLLVLLVLASGLSCRDKAGDSADGSSAPDGGTPTTDGGLPGDGGGGGACPYDWRGAPCSTEWEGLYNCDECGQAYTCRTSSAGAPWPLSWSASEVPCACIDPATGALLDELAGCEGVGETGG